MSDSPFLILRYPPGGAGRFLSTVMQCSDEVAFWDPVIEKNKNTSSFIPMVEQYVNQKFPVDLFFHLRLEPDLPYYSEFYSGTFDRGNEITLNEYNEKMSNAGDDYYFNNIINNKKVNLILHKSHIPSFMFESLMINVIINSDRSMQWVKKMLWRKHYHLLNSNQILCLAHHENYCNPKRKHLVTQYSYDSPIITVDDVEEFKENQIGKINNLALFTSTTNLFSHETNSKVSHAVFELDNIFLFDTFFDNIKTICTQYFLKCPDSKLLSKIYEIWWNRQKC